MPDVPCPKRRLAHLRPCNLRPCNANPLPSRPDAATQESPEQSRGVSYSDPSPVHSAPSSPLPDGDDEAERLGWRLAIPTGLARLLRQSASAHPLRIVVADNSGSMLTPDGTVLLFDERGAALRSVRRTRWEELTHAAAGAARLALALSARLDVHLLNPAPDAHALSLGAEACTLVAVTGRRLHSAAELHDTLERVSPEGWTPLAEAIEAVVASLAPVAPRLRAAGQRAVVTIATDGLPDDRPRFLRAVTALQALPVWLIVRLCTSEAAVVAYWAELDKELEAPLEVLGGLRAEAAEVRSLNAWLTYGPPLHEAREFGLYEKLFDLLDEAPLLPSQLRRVCSIVLGCALPEPEVDAAAFVAAVRDALAPLPHVYDPLRRETRPWIDCEALLAHILAAAE
mmetsp:Transcript_1763/g.5278  ORF Transcript_1763/g.5278 Transcript_1763/m.5278 type:complete len:399 (+) Transcript_1763:693-1889(+)